MINTFIEKLDKLNLFLVEKNGDLILKGRKGELTKQEIDLITKDNSIVDFIRQNKKELVDHLIKSAAPRHIIYKLSPLQEGLLFHHLYNSDSSAYTEQLTIDFTKGFNIEIFKSCWNYILRNHSILRSSFLHDQVSIPVQCVHTNVQIPIVELDFSSFSQAAQNTRIHAFLAEDLEKGFNFNTPPLMRIGIIKTGSEIYKMVWTYHHILLDGWSLPIIMEEFMLAYEALTKGQSFPERQEDKYEDFIKYINSKNEYEEEVFWKTYLKDLETPGLLPFVGNTTERNKGGASTSTTTLAFGTSFSEKIMRYARLHNITVNTLIQGIWSLLLSKYTGNPDTVFGTTVSGRPTDLENAEQKVGLYINILPLRSIVSPEETIEAWLSKIQADHVAAREFQYTALNNIQNWIGLRGDFFDSILVFENYPVGEVLNQQDWTLKTGEIYVREETNYLLTIIAGLGEEVKLTFSYNDTLLPEHYVAAIKGHFEMAFRELIDQEKKFISEITILSKQEKQTLLSGYNHQLNTHYPQNKTVVNLFEEQVLKTPELIAVVSGAEVLNYNELNARSNQLAHYLRSKGVREESLVALCLDRSCEMIIAILAVLKAGGAYVPIDPEYPQDRINYLLEDTGAQWGITTKALQQRIENKTNVILLDAEWGAIAALPESNPGTNLRPDNLAYIIYTSGSTGLPKGVMIEHKNIVRLFKNEACLFDFNEKDIWTLFHSYCFDFSVWELFGALLFGGKLLVISSEMRKDPIAFSNLLIEEGVTVLNQTPGAFYQLQDQMLLSFRNSALRYVIFGGEALNPAMLRQWQITYPGCRLINMYGITETTVHVTYKELLEKDTHSNTSNIGKPIPTLSNYVLDTSRNLSPVGIAGELYVGGSGLARGYLNRPELTEERFVPNPFTQKPGDRLYKTGDLVKWLPNGELEYLGRIDNQVKIHGYRIELGEIETVLQACERVKQGTVLAKEDGKGHKRLYAYVVAEEGQFDRKEIQGYLSAKLPDYMVPSVIVELPELPLTSNGKIDKKALPLPDIAAQIIGEYVAPRNEVEEKLAQIWKEVLKVEKAGIHDNFFDVGGHSLMAIRVVSAIRKNLQLEVKVKDIFSFPTIETLAKNLGATDATPSLPPLLAEIRPEKIPLSYSQERLWFIDQLQGSTAYHLPTVLRINNALDKVVLETALRALVNRHEILRTVIKSEDGLPYQEIMPDDNWSMAYSEGPEFDQAGYLEDFIAAETMRPFDLSKDYMLRVHLIRCTEKEHVLVLVVHHIASDGWSESILVKDLVHLYGAASDNRDTGLAPMQIQYADYAIWQRKFLSGEQLAVQLAWWKETLKGIEPLMLPTDFPRPAIQSPRGGSYRFSIGKDLMKKIKSLSLQSEATLFMTLLSTYKILLSRYSGQTDICVGVPSANRNQKEVESLVGFFVNTLVVRSNLGENPDFAHLLNQVKSTMHDVFSHQDIPFEQLVEQIETDRSLSRNPLFQVMFSLQNAPEATTLQLGNLSLSPILFTQNTTQFDLTLSVIETPDNLQMELEYCRDLFAQETIVRMAGHFQMLLEAIASNPKQGIAQLPILTAEETQRILQDFSHSAAGQPGYAGTILDLFEEQTAKTPHHLAAVLDNQQLSYEELNTRANQIARYLQEKGVKEGAGVAIHLDRSLDMLVGILGVMKTGGTYVPVDREYPIERVNFLISDSGCSFVLNEESLLEFKAVQSNYKSIDLPLKPSAQTTAYIIYTSGSTGQPKGVLIGHDALVDYVLSFRKIFDITDTDRVIQQSALSFDTHIEEIFPALISGATVLIARNGGRDFYALTDLIARQGATVLSTTPLVLQEINQLDFDYSRLRVIISGGDVLKASYIDRILNRVKVVNTYGPSETTVVATYCEITALADHLPIGKPFPNREVYVLDAAGNFVPEGIPGEICIGGSGLSKGYLNNPALTSEKFVANPFKPEQKIYKTGDIGIWSPEGNLLFAGRKDDQVKIRGYRIELSEIESALIQASAVKDCAVLVKKNTRGESALAAFVVPAGLPGTLDVPLLRTHLSARLPDYMTPVMWMELESLPLTSTGKINKKALAGIEFSAIPGNAYVAPGSTTEKKLAEIWMPLLHLKKVGIHDNFFESGGHSLMAMRVISHIRKQFGKEIKISDIFNYPTIEKLAAHIESGLNNTSLPPLQKTDGHGKIPLSYSQERLWFIDQFEGSTQYHQPTVLRLTNEMDIKVLERAFHELINRHHILRTVIKAEEGQAYQEVLPISDWRIAFSEGLNFQDTDYLHKFIQAEINRPFDLARDYMLRAHLIKCAADEHVLVLVVHHIASDAWSESILVRDLVALYRAGQTGDAPALEALAVQYADYAIWQRKYVTGDYLEAQLSWWEKQLQEIEPLKFPADFPRPTMQSTRGASMNFELNRHLSAQIKSLSLQSGSSLFMTLLTAFKVLLHRYTGQDDICVGTPMANRNHHDVESLVGFFINTLVLRNNLAGNPGFLSLLAQVKTNTLAAFAHQEVPFEKIVDRIEKDRDLSRTPIFQVMFTLENTPEVPDLELGTLGLTSESSGYVMSNFDLSFSIKETDTGLWVSIVYSTDLFTEDRMARMAGHFQNLLQSIISNPNQPIAQLPILGAAEQQQVLFGFNNTRFERPKDKTIVDLFEEQAVKTPDNIALIFGETKLTYREVNERSNQLGAYLSQQFTIQANELVGIRLDRSEWMILTILGILKSGGAYLPIDVKFPENRVKFMLEDSQCKALVDEQTLAAFKNEESLYQKTPLHVDIMPCDLAYVIYTSGSTGQSKGVQIEHGSLVNEISFLKAAFNITEQDRILQTANYVFDPSVEQIFLALLSGATLVLINRETLVDGELMEKTLDEQQITYLHLTPSLLKNITPRSYHSLRQISAGGELCTLELARAWAPYLQFVNKYGPTEATITSTIFPFSLVGDSDKATSLPIGKPLGNSKVYIADKHDNVVPIGVFGEIYIGGDGLARGYLNRPELTKEQFIDSPFEANEKVYKTGDLGRWLPNGNLEFLARKDDQVKIRGYRIELGEVESVLHRSPLVSKSVVIAKETSDGDKRLVAYIVPQIQSAKGLDKDVVRRFLETQLPDYMIPASIMELPELPLTVNGKVDKKALPDPDADLLATGNYTAPRNKTEADLANIWMNLLKVENLGVHDNFFEIGGHSLLAMRVISAIRKELQREIKVKDIFSHPTIARLASNLNAVAGEVDLPFIAAADRPEKIPLSYAQERLWFIDQLEGSVQYHQPTVLRLKNKLNKNLLEAAIAALIERHEVLRTVIRSEEGQAYQEIMPATYWHMAYSEVKVSENRLRDLIASEINRPFDLSSDYMLRAHLINCAPEDHVLVLVMHHIAADGWSQSLLVDDLAKLYRAGIENHTPDLTPMPIQYADYAIWQRKYLVGEYLETHLNWWEQQLEGLTPLNLPLDYPRPVSQSNKGASTGFRIDPDMTRQLKELSVQSGASLFMTMLATFNVLLSRYSGQEDICLGMPIANRNQKELESMVGFFINTLVLRNDLSGNPEFLTLLKRVKENTLSAFAHQEVPFEQIVERVESERNLSRSPIYQVVFNMQNTPEVSDLELHGLHLSFEASGHDLSRFDLTVSVNESPKGLIVELTYCRDLFNEATMERMAGHFQTLLASIIADPNKKIAQLEMLTAPERRQLLYEFNTASVDYPKDKTLVELFEAQAQKTPDTLALMYKGTELTYRQLDQQTNQLANYLRESGVKTGSFVAICIDDSLDMVLAIWGVLKSGGTYVPLDFDNPADRLGFIIDHVNAEHVLTNKSCERLITRKENLKVIVLDEEWVDIREAPDTPLNAPLTPENLIYVIHTSGSTGKPKGVMLTHRNVADHLYGFFSRVQFRSSQTFAVMSTMSADLANTVLFGALISGGTIHLLAKSVYTDARKTHDYFKKHSIDFMKLVPSHWRALENEEGILLPNRTIVFGGEVLSIEILEKIKAQNPRLEIINHYGPTEVTIGKVCYRVDFNQLPTKTPIGKPFCNTRMYVVDKHLSLCPIGVPGELLIGGDGVSKGYINRPELTAERYIKNPFSQDEGDILYRSGDLIRWLPDGNLDFMDRVDDQIKIRGYRIELGEINIVLKQAPTVSQSIVLAPKDANGQNRLVAYIVPEGIFNKAEVQAYLKSQLPDYMIPALLIELEKFPLNANGKIDRKALPDPESAVMGIDSYVAPENETAIQLAAIWKQLLHAERVGIHDNFFEIGGHSLLAMRVITAIRKEFALNIPLKVIFSFPTIAELENYIYLIRESVEAIDHKESEVIEL